MCECRPLYKVRCVSATLATVTLTVNRLFADIGQNAPFRLCIARGILPRNNTGQIILTDGIVSFLVLRGDGNFLRNDSLHDYLCNSGRCDVALDAYKGNDPAHVTIFNRMCSSSFILAETAPVASPFAAQAETARVEAA